MIDEFLNPKSIALIGASEDKKKVGGIILEKLLEFKGEVFPINPKYKEILKKKCYCSVKDVKKRIDLAVITTPARVIKEVIEECGEAGIKNVIIISAGFSEEGKKEEEEKIRKTAKERGIHLLGPNCFGVANPYLNLDTTFSNKKAKRGNIAFISQSGALWSYLADISHSSKEIGFSGFVSLGNMSDLNFNDFIEYFEKDERTKKIILYIERLEEGREFIDICKKSKKEIIAIKAGKSKQGLKAAISHTGSLATDFKVYQGAFKQAKIKNERFLCSALGISSEKQKRIELGGKDTIIITNAGGAGALIADYCEEKELKLLTREEGGKNPWDILGTANSKDYENAIKGVNEREKYDLMVIILTPQKMSEPEETAKEIIRNCDKKKTIVYFLGEESILDGKKELEKEGFLCFKRIKDSLEGVKYE